jgi:hypothetical protein
MPTGKTARAGNEAEFCERETIGCPARPAAKSTRTAVEEKKRGRTLLRPPNENCAWLNLPSSDAMPQTNIKTTHTENCISASTTMTE